MPFGLLPVLLLLLLLLLIAAPVAALDMVPEAREALEFRIKVFFLSNPPPTGTGRLVGLAPGALHHHEVGE